ncbi:unnamed protein product [Peniophora sp. CBMAI 1063]|nr:unnamed protein product [Peniophora sp. CBMAI 1063]
MDAPDSRTRRKIALNSRTVLSPSASARVFSEVVLPGLVLVASLWTAKDWLLSRDVPKSWVLMRTLACSALVHLAREAWAGNTVKIAHSVNLSMLPAFGILSVSFLLQQTCLLVALSHSSSTRVAAYVLFSLACAKAFSNSSMFPRAIPVFVGLAWSFASDASYSVNTVRDALPGYLALAVHVPLTCSVEYFHAQLSIKLGPATASAAGTLGASLMAVVAYAAREASYTFKPHSTVVPLTHLLAIPLLAYTAQPSSSTLQLSTNLTPQIYTLTGTLVVGASLVLNAVFGDAKPSWIDLTMPILVLYGGLPAKSKSDSGVPETPLSLVLRSHLKTIMDNAESRKIFYFLMLNISFMFVQMLYGIWTNSLGLISDAIHMGFDCMAIGVGLFASIMATWPPNERFTYGYGRIETLSGFANGIFLVLISMFIIFEAIQRLLDPPEMNTNQLLLISTMGLGVNLFGMFAMGGHHHHAMAQLTIIRTITSTVMTTCFMIILTIMATRTHMSMSTSTTTITAMPPMNSLARIILTMHTRMTMNTIMNTSTVMSMGTIMTTTTAIQSMSMGKTARTMIMIITITAQESRSLTEIATRLIRIHLNLLPSLRAATIERTQAHE